jgi:hypothetical protein
VKVPHWALEADVSAVGTFGDLSRFDLRLVDLLFTRVDPAALAELRRRKPEAAFELLIGSEIISLWLGDKRIAVVSAPQAWGIHHERDSHD